MGYFLGLSVASSKRISSSTVVSFPSEMFSFNLIKNQQAVSWFSSGNKKKAFLDQLFDIPKKDSSVQTPLWYKLIEQVNLTIPVSGGVCGSSISVELINAYWNIPTDPQGSFCLITLLQPSEILFHTKKQHSLHLTVSNLEGRKKKSVGRCIITSDYILSWVGSGSKTVSEAHTKLHSVPDQTFCLTLITESRDTWQKRGSQYTCDQPLENIQKQFYWTSHCGKHNHGHQIFTEVFIHYQCQVLQETDGLFHRVFTSVYMEFLFTALSKSFQPL